jgi:endo-1,4-beta-mannosidase
LTCLADYVWLLRADGKIKYNQDMLDGLSWLLDQCQQRGLKLMLTLTNGNPHEFGGMRQYVRCGSTFGSTSDVA